MKNLHFFILTLFVASAITFTYANVFQKVIPAAEHYEGGEQALVEAINKETVYPPMAKRNRVQGTALIHITLEEDGTMSESKVLKNPGAGTGDEALRVVRTLKFNAPGYKANYQIPVVFKL